MKQITNYSTGKRKEQKKRLREILLNRDFNKFREWIVENKRVVSFLNSALFDREILVQWRAVEAYGVYARELAKDDVEKVREIIRRMLWGMNDESGILMWRAGEVIGEILVNVPDLVLEYANFLPGHLEIEPFERGVHWGMARVSKEYPGIYATEQHYLERSLANVDPYRRVMAVLALDEDAVESLRPKLNELVEDHDSIESYDAKHGRFYRTTVSEVACHALADEESMHHFGRYVQTL